MQFPPGIAIMSGHVVYSKERPIPLRGQEAGRLNMVCRRGFRIVEPRRASSGSVRGRLPLLGEGHSQPVGEDRHWRCTTPPQRARAPPQSAQHHLRTAMPVPEMALGQRRHR